MNKNSDPAVILTPLYDAAEKLGAQFVSRHGWRLPKVFSTVEEELVAVRQRVALADVSADGKVTVEGRQSEAAIQATWDGPSPHIGQGRASGAGHVYRLRADLFFVATPPGTVGDAVADLSEAAQQIGELVTVTDVTHGRAGLMVVGPVGAELLSRLCGLDFHPGQFPNLAAKQSSVAKTRQLILRHDLGAIPAYVLYGARSLGAYVWETIMEAGRDLDIKPIGLDALRQL